MRAAIISFCVQDWALLRQRVDAAGLGHLVAVDREAMAGIVERFNSAAEPQPLDFEPLMAATSMIAQIAIGYISPAEMQRLGEHSDGALCPACALRSFDWLEAAATHCKQVAADLGLLLPDLKP